MKHVSRFDIKISNSLKDTNNKACLSTYL